MPSSKRAPLHSAGARRPCVRERWRPRQKSTSPRSAPPYRPARPYTPSKFLQRTNSRPARTKIRLQGLETPAGHALLEWLRVANTRGSSWGVWGPWRILTGVPLPYSHRLQSSQSISRSSLPAYSWRLPALMPNQACPNTAPPPPPVWWNAHFFFFSAPSSKFNSACCPATLAGL